MPEPGPPLSPAVTAAVVAGIGFGVGLAGDACHVAAGATTYEWDGVPEIWNSQIWFPFLVAGAVLATAWLAERAGLPAVKTRTRGDAVQGAALVLALYALTALLSDPTTVVVVLIGALALAIWAWWDPSPGALLVASAAAILGPAAEILLVELGAASYADDHLLGVAPWLPFLYFAAGSVAAGLWAAIQHDGAPAGGAAAPHDG